jgi:DNA topoisomerase VI subunit A
LTFFHLLHTAFIFNENSLRDCYYMCSKLFGRQSNADAAAARVAASIPTMRNNLNIVAAPKGLVAGDLTYVTEHGNLISVDLFAPNGVFIPPRPERMANIATNAPFVLMYVGFVFC